MGYTKLLPAKNKKYLVSFFLRELSLNLAWSKEDIPKKKGYGPWSNRAYLNTIDLQM